MSDEKAIRFERAQVNIATMDDLREIVNFLIHDFHGRYAATLPPADFGKVVSYVGNHIVNGVVFLARDDSGALSGVISGTVQQPWFSSHSHVAEGCFFVRPGQRGTGAGIDLLKHLKAWARERGLPLMCAVSTGDEVERKDRFFERQGFERIGGIYRTRGLKDV